MDGQKSYQPVYRQFIHKIEKGFLLLDESSQNEIRKFIISQQHKTGAFNDRSGNADIYYSLFGAMLSEALKLVSQKRHLKNNIGTIQKNKKKIVDKFALLLIEDILAEEESKKPSIFQLVKLVFQEGNKINVSYRIFLFLLSFDAFYGRKKFLYFLMRIFLSFYSLPEDSPCSIFAAFTAAKFLTGKKVKKEVQSLFSFFEEGKGFKVFREIENADVLSTAVALFTLKIVGADLRIVTPGCLNLVQQNYESGAFLSGDGDLTKDLEYTFYGLLALGTLS